MPLEARSNAASVEWNVAGVNSEDASSISRATTAIGCKRAEDTRSSME